MEKNDALTALAALAQETRLDIFRTLIERGPDGLPAGRIAAMLNLPPATLSFHLKELKQAGLVVCRRDGRSLVYGADFGRMTALVGYLTENCCGGNGAACGVPACDAPSATQPLPKRA